MATTRGQVLRYSYRWANTFEKADFSSRLSNAEMNAELLSRLSEAMFIDEAAALSLNLPPAGKCDDCKTTEGAQISVEEHMSAALDPSSSTSFCSASPASSQPPSPLAQAVWSLSNCSKADVFFGALSSAVCAFMGSDVSAMNRVASELLLAGTDMKAILSDGVICRQHIELKCMSRCDFSTISFISVSSTDVDFSRSLFYSAVFHDCIFVRCCFDGCILKELRCSGRVRFEDCSFRFANLVLRFLSDNKTANTDIGFDRCDFDLADFDGSDKLPASCFINCYNTHLASRFPVHSV